MASIKEKKWPSSKATIYPKESMNYDEALSIGEPVFSFKIGKYSTKILTQNNCT